jgi:ATP-binding protein involved in chromosome partitioning
MRDKIEERLRTVQYPGFSRDIVSFGLLKNVVVEGDSAVVDIEVTTHDEGILDELRRRCQVALEPLHAIRRFDIRIARNAPTTPPVTAGQPQATAIPGIAHIIAVASGKGGVGKSTLAANLACAFERLGQRVGLCDCDIYGPSMGLMFGTTENPEVTEEEKIIPIQQHGIRLMSMGFLVDADSPAVLRGPMVTRFTQQFLRGVEWGDLDILVLDLPPGTGDIQLTIVQTVALTGAIIVTTPQEVALIDARKAVTMFHKVNVPILGLVENMSWFECPDNGKKYPIFGEGGGKREAQRLGVPLLGEIPIDVMTREAGDTGTPVVRRHPGSPVTRACMQAAQAILGKLD